jgi:hypothetical protein
MALKELLNQKLNRLESIPDNLIGTTAKIQQEILTEVIVLLETLDRKGDLILLNEANILRIEQIGNRLSEIVFDTEYTDALTGFAKEFNTQGVLNREILSQIAGKEVLQSDIFQSILRKSQADAISLLNRDAVQANFVDPMKQILTESVSSGTTFRQAVSSLKDYIQGTEELDGSLERYVKQVARDGFNIADRRYTQVISEDLGFEWFRYVGGKVEDTRQFCLDRMGKIFHKSTIEGWAKLEWQGKFRGTTAQNIFSVLGGYNCMHALIAVSEEEAKG